MLSCALNIFQQRSRWLRELPPCRSQMVLQNCKSIGSVLRIQRLCSNSKRVDHTDEDPATFPCDCQVTRCYWKAHWKGLWRRKRIEKRSLCKSYELQRAIEGKLRFWIVLIYPFEVWPPNLHWLAGKEETCNERTRVPSSRRKTWWNAGGRAAQKSC